MFGSHIGKLHIKQRKQTEDGPADILLWAVSGHQGNRWREGRVFVPRNNNPYQVTKMHFLTVLIEMDVTLLWINARAPTWLYTSSIQVVIEGIVEEKRWGDIAVDDIKVLDGLSMQDCKGEFFGLCFHWKSILYSHQILRLLSFPSEFSFAGIHWTVDLFCPLVGY